jgi:phosphatidylserine/phosphatidylglycerophosphate/cardiolipin synthase-like enzyme
MAMATALDVYANEDDVLLFWTVDEPIKDCLGFAINRRMTDSTGKKTEGFLLNRVGFANDAPAGGATEHAQVSTQWPFQRFSWSDHDPTTGDTVSYQVVPMVRDNTGTLVQLDDQASAWSPPRTLGPPVGSRFEPHFNRGFVISQFMARFLAENHLDPKTFKDDLQDSDEQKIRNFLSGDLRQAMLDELDAAVNNDAEIYSALFELSDDELVDALVKLGGRAHIVLANGAVKHRGDDENADARQKLRDNSVDVEADNRFIAPRALGHNKFMVRTDRTGAPVTAWTGSTNWSPTGLCTQLNNGLLINDTNIAQVYLDQWERLRQSASDFPPDLLEANDQPKAPQPPAPGAPTATVWFSRTNGGVDLDALNDVVNSAKQGILFLMFMPGNHGVLSTVTQRIPDSGLYLRGVVSTLPKGYPDESQVQVSLTDGTDQHEATLDVIQPQGVDHPFAYFAGEVTRQQFLKNIGFAIIHSKILVIDPFSPDATVVTGSHNFSLSASAKNDENFIIIKGDTALAEAYTVNIMSAYDHYRWRQFVNTESNPFSGLQDNDGWMAPKLASTAIDRQFFCRQE